MPKKKHSKIEKLEKNDRCNIENDYIWNYSYNEPNETYHVLAGERKNMTEKQRETYMIGELKSALHKWQGKEYHPVYLQLRRNVDNICHNPTNKQFRFQTYNTTKKKWIKN